MIEDEIGQYVEPIGIIDGITGGGGDIDIYWESSIEIEADEVVAVSDITEFWDSDDSIRRDDWLRSSSFW